MSHRRSLEQLNIAEPCHEAWDAMSREGDARRFCASCSKHVHDLASMSREEADRLANSDVSVCLRITHDSTGRVVTRDDLPIVPRRRWMRRVAAIAAMLGIGSMTQSGCMKGAVAPKRAADDDSVMTRTAGMVPPHRSIQGEIAPTTSPTTTPSTH